MWKLAAILATVVALGAAGLYFFWWLAVNFFDPEDHTNDYP